MSTGLNVSLVPSGSVIVTETLANPAGFPWFTISTKVWASYVGPSGPGYTITLIITSCPNPTNDGVTPTDVKVSLSGIAVYCAKTVC